MSGAIEVYNQPKRRVLNPAVILFCCRFIGTIGLSIGLISCQSAAAPSARTSPRPAIEFETRPDRRGDIHLLRIPSGNRLALAIATTLQPLDQFAGPDAIALINGGYFDPSNQQTTSVLIQDGQLRGDPLGNANLVNNPKLTPYLPQIFDRSELRRYDCAGQVRYGIDRRHGPIPKGCQLQFALGAGPQLLPQLTATEEAFYVEENGVVVRDPIGRDQPNARSAIGLRPDGGLILVMVAQRNEPGAQGLTLPELAALLKAEGATQALNLDGGSSSSLWFNGKPYFGKRDAEGQLVKRSIKSALVVKSP
jgi:hypothetical protein